MSIKIAHSSNDDISQAVGELSKQFGDGEPVLVLFFASSRYNIGDLAVAMRSTFSSAQTAGCTTSGELISGQMLKSSVVALAMDSSTISKADVRLVGLDNIEDNVHRALDGFAEGFGLPANAMRPDEFVGMVFTDGLSGGEETVMEALGRRTNVSFVGGSAGDDLDFKQTWVCGNGEAVSKASVLVLAKAAVPFEILKTQSFEKIGKTLTPTKVDEATRTVVEFDSKPAVDAYSEALGVPVSDLGDHFMTNPVGLMVSETEPFVRSPQRIDGTSVVFYCAVKPGMALEILKSQNIVSDTQDALEEIRSRGPVSGIINFHCILRTLQLEKEGTTDDYGRVFAQVPMVGFSTYGESYIGHINQTSTMLVFRE